MTGHRTSSLAVAVAASLLTTTVVLNLHGCHGRTAHYAARRPNTSLMVGAHRRRACRRPVGQARCP